MKPALFLYNLLLTLVSPPAFIIGYAATKLKGGEKGFAERFGLIRLKGGPRSKSVWFHCASVGEVRSIAGVAERLREKYPDISVIVSSMTAAGRREARNFIKADEAFFLPIENGPAIGYLIKLLGVKVFFIVDTEIWPNLIYAAGSNSRLIMINGKMSEKTFKTYYRFRLFFRPLFKKFSAILTKSANDFRRFAKIAGSEKNIAEAGNIKFRKRRKKTDMEPVNGLSGLKYALAASTHPPEEDIFLDAFRTASSGFDRLAIAPRHIERAAEIKELAKNKGFDASLFSEGTEAKVIVIDNIGMLERLYAGAEKIFIGGSITPVGGHNIYEALQFEKTAAVGPYMSGFEEICVPAAEAGLIETVKNAEEIALWLQKETSKKDFAAFFRLIDEKNKKTINKIEELVNDVLAS